MTVRFLHAIAGLLVLATQPACGHRVGFARLYSLEKAERIEMTFHFTSERNGPAYATLASGERLDGEFVVWHTRSGRIGMSGWNAIRSQIKTLERSGSGSDPGSPERGSLDWPVIYGFGTESEAEPVGTAMLIGNRGTSIEVVLYHIETAYSVQGDGLARDNRGNWYRVLIGDLPESP